jgi:hypothetical protein
MLDVSFSWLKASPVAWTFLKEQGISKLLFLIKKISNFFSAVNLNFFLFLVIKTLDPDW